MQRQTSGPAIGSGPAALESQVIGKPDKFDGSADKWRDWSVIFRAHLCSHFCEAQATLRLAERTDE
eukprot:3998023-Karenia_brevis.AAC.1